MSLVRTLANVICLGLVVTLVSQIVLLLVLATTTVHFIRQNKLVREEKRKEPLEGQPGFYYTL
jgi:hypothetical protein